MSEPKPSKKTPASYNADLSYDPQGSGMDHDAFFAEVAPGVANSGNLANKWGPEGDHWAPDQPPANLKGD